MMFMLSSVIWGSQRALLEPQRKIKHQIHSLQKN